MNNFIKIYLSIYTLFSLVVFIANKARVLKTKTLKKLLIMSVSISCIYFGFGTGAYIHSTKTEYNFSENTELISINKVINNENKDIAVDISSVPDEENCNIHNRFKLQYVYKDVHDNSINIEDGLVIPQDKFSFIDDDKNYIEIVYTAESYEPSTFAKFLFKNPKHIPDKATGIEKYKFHVKKGSVIKNGIIML